MKRFLVTILALIYISTSTGAVLHMHYCMGKLVDWGFWKNKSEKCGGCGMEKKDGESGGCCKDERKHVKLEKDQKITETAFKVIQSTSSATVTISFVRLPGIHIVSAYEMKSVSHTPLRSSGVTVYIRNCVFLI